MQFTEDLGEEYAEERDSGSGPVLSTDSEQPSGRGIFQGQHLTRSGQSRKQQSESQVSIYLGPCESETQVGLATQSHRVSHPREKGNAAHVQPTLGAQSGNLVMGVGPGFQGVVGKHRQEAFGALLCGRQQQQKLRQGRCVGLPVPTGSCEWLCWGIRTPLQMSLTSYIRASRGTQTLTIQ